MTTGLSHPGAVRCIPTYRRNSTRSSAAHLSPPKPTKKNLKRIPLGVASNYRQLRSWPMFVKDARGSHFRDLDGNEYIDFNLSFGALMAGHCHPAVGSREERLLTGTMFGMPHDMECDLADEICKRFPVEKVRFGNSETEVTMHAIRLPASPLAATRSSKWKAATTAFTIRCWSA